MSTEKIKKTEIKSPKNSLVLRNISGIKIGDSSITLQDLEDDKKKWTGFALLPEVGEKNFTSSNEEIIRKLLFESVPFEITGSTNQNTILRAELARFPYSINGKRSFQSFGLRITPETGSIEQINFNSESSVALNKQSVSRSLFEAELGNGSLHLEIYFESQDLTTLQAIKAPVGFQESVTLKRISFFD